MERYCELEKVRRSRNQAPATHLTDRLDLVASVREFPCHSCCEKLGHIPASCGVLL